MECTAAPGEARNTVPNVLSGWRPSERANQVCPATGLVGKDGGTHHGKHRGGNTCRGALGKLKAVGRICRARPHVWLVPLVVAALGIGLGVWLVCKGAADQADSKRREAQSQADSAASSLQLTIQKAVLPLEQAADWISYTRNYRVINDTWQERMSAWWSTVDPGSASFLVLTTQAVGTHVWPRTPASTSVLGLDALALPGIREETLRVLKGGTLAVSALSLDTVTGTDTALYLVAFSKPIFIPNVTEDETWGQPYNATNCPPGVCYINATRSKWYGSIIMTISVNPFISSSGPLANCMKLYNSQIWVPAIDGSARKVVLGPPGTVKSQPGDAVVGVIPVADQQWELYIWPDSWEPSWKVPLIVVVVVASLAVVALLFAVLLSREEHQVLLRSLLPEETIKRLRREIDWEDLKGTQQALEVVEIETPAKQMMAILRAILHGSAPNMAMVLAVQRALQQSMDVYRPPSKELQSRLKQADNMDDEARLALAQQLGSWEWNGTADGRPEGEAGGEQAQGDGRAPRSSFSSSDVRGILHELARKPGSKASVGGRESAEFHTIGVSLDGAATPASLPSVAEREAPPPPPPPPPAPPPPPGDVEAGEGPLVGDGRSEPLLVVRVVEAPIMVEVDRILAQATSSWEFDAYALEAATQGHPLSVLAFWLMHTSGCIQSFGINPATLARFLRRIEAGYPATNPYHNARHAADVLQTLHMILHHGGLAPGYADQTTVLTCYVAAVVHDFEHRGLSTDFLTSTGDRLAVLYNDRSPMENHHLAAAWALMMQPQYSIVGGLGKEALAKMRKLMIDLVLGTDMKQHFSIMGQFSTQHSSDGSMCDTVNSMTHSRTPSHSQRMDSYTAPCLQPVNEGERVLSLQMALKCADLGHLTESLPVHLRWVQDLEQEFFLQGDEERSRGMPISPLCDRTKEGVTKSQVGFFDFVCLPLFSHFTSRFKGARPLFKGLLRNYEHWNGVGTSTS